MKNKFIKAMAAVISCAAVVSTGLATAASVSATYADSDWTAYSSTGETSIYSGLKEDSSSVYVSNSGKQKNSSGKYVNVGTCAAVIVKLEGVAVNTASKPAKPYWYQCESRNGNKYKCTDLRIKAYDTRVIYQYIRENFPSVCKEKGILQARSECHAEISFRTDVSGSIPHGQWSPDTIGWYPQISGQ